MSLAQARLLHMVKGIIGMCLLVGIMAQVHATMPAHATGPFPPLTPLYRYYRSDTHKHFYSQNYAELGDGTGTWHLEGNVGKVAGWTYSTADLSIDRPLYRLYHPSRQKHFYTTHTAEKDAAVRNGFKYEGIVGYLLSRPSPLHGFPSQPLYRLYHPGFDDHFYTRSTSEVSTAVANGYSNEGIIGHILD